MHRPLRWPALLRVAALAGALALSTTASLAQDERPSLIPAPAHAVAKAGVFRLQEGAVLAPATGDAEARRTAVYLRDLLRRTRGLNTVVRPGASGAVRLRLDPAAPEGAEAYALRVTPQGVEIAARAPAGLFYGAVTLWGLATADGGHGGVTLADREIEDAPRFAWRGLLLDSVRHFQSVAFIEKFIDVMALHKLNVLQWHLTDDQGWRLEIKAYPKLTSVGAWRTPAGAEGHDAKGRPRRYGGFYTQAQVRGIVAYAAARHVMIVPEIELPGHATAAIAAYPQLASAPGTPRAPSPDWGVFANLYRPDAESFTFLQTVLTEVMGLFPSPYIHIGGDEAVKGQWRASPAVQAKIKALGLKNEDALQSWFVAQMGRFLSAHGRRLVGWDEILQGGDLPPGAVVTSWRGLSGATAAAKAEHDTVLAPIAPLYLDNRNSGDPSEPPGRGLIFTLKDVYGFDALAPDLTEAQQAHVIGVQAQLWTEHIRLERWVEWMAFPRAAAVAEIGWSPAVARSWPDFASRMPAQMARYASLGVNAATSPFAPPDPLTPKPPLRRASQQLTLCSGLGLNLEDDAPYDGPRATFLVDIMNPCWKWPDVDLSHGRDLTIRVGRLPFNFELGADAAKIPLPPQATPEGELVIRDRCDGETLAVVPLAQAAANPAVSTVHATLPPRPRPAELCFTFTRNTLDPFWVLDAVELSAPPFG